MENITSSTPSAPVAPAAPSGQLVSALEGVAQTVGAAIADAAEPAAAGAVAALTGGAGAPAAAPVAITVAEKVGASALGITPERLQLAIELTQTLTSLVPAADRAAIAKSVHAAFAELVHAI